jgi:hypothetical protein
MPALRASCLLLILGLLLATSSGCGGEMRADELGRSVDTLGSAASEGGLLAQGVAEKRTKATFVRVRARELGETVEHEAEKLEDATATGPVAAAKRRAVDLAGSISEALGELQTAPADKPTAAETERTLDTLADRASRLAQALA